MFKYDKKLSIIIGVTLILFGIFAFANQQNQKTPENKITITPTPTIDTPQKVTLKGEVVCLPHKDTSGPQTLECAFGLKADDGNYYALDAGSQVPPPYNTGEHIQASGIFTPIERLSTDHWQKYNVKGIFSITDSVKVF